MDFCALIAYYIGVFTDIHYWRVFFGSVSGSFMSLAIDGNILPHAAILAPMSGVTDWPFRRAVRRCGGGLVVTEMIASAAVLRDVKSERRREVSRGFILATRRPSWARSCDGARGEAEVVGRGRGPHHERVAVRRVERVRDLRVGRAAALQVEFRLCMPF